MKIALFTKIVNEIECCAAWASERAKLYQIKKRKKMNLITCKGSKTAIIRTIIYNRIDHDHDNKCKLENCQPVEIEKKNVPEFCRRQYKKEFNRKIISKHTSSSSKSDRIFL